MRTNELTGAALDWAVAKCEGRANDGVWDENFSSNWLLGGPIIEREEIALEPMTHDEHGDGWLATRVEGPAICMEFGPTMLVAAMRCFVVSHLGDEIEVPDELTI